MKMKPKHYWIAAALFIGWQVLTSSSDDVEETRSFEDKMAREGFYSPSPIEYSSD